MKVAAAPQHSDTANPGRMVTAKKASISSTGTAMTEATSSTGTVSDGDSSERSLSGSAISKRSRGRSLYDQKQEVLRLLLSRHTAVEGKSTLPGEALFLINWDWWCRWSDEVDLFYSGDSRKTRRILELFPAGARLPKPEEIINGDTDNDDSSSEDSHTASGDTTKKNGGKRVLGPINNACLYLDPKATFHRNWYYSTDSAKLALTPNLVRGYHYELIPREVYQALRCWYGENTPPICRRADATGRIRLYDPPVGSSISTSTDAPTSARCAACLAPHAVAKCLQCYSVHYCRRSCQESHWTFHKKICKQIAKAQSSDPISPTVESFSSSAGKRGLNNLGNSCFMNSALQCLSHATPLTRHFLSHKYKLDVNASNPLGTGGKLSTAYADLIKELWMGSGTSFSPTALKRAVALFAPRFAGTLQHDSQEFLAYLLDGLHEDLNRIQKAPYVELPEVNGAANMAIEGARAWGAHLRRNDSIVQDCIYGQFQSTCVCPRCHRASVTFDAFNHVSLEIPQPSKETKSIAVLVFRQAPPFDQKSSSPQKSISPQRYGLTLKRDCCMKDLKLALADLTGIPSGNLVLAEMYENAIYDLINDDAKVTSIGSNDLVAAYEMGSPPLDQNAEGKNLLGLVTQYLIVRTKEGNLGRAKFGFPLIVGLDRQASCRAIWDQLWSQVDALVRQPGAKGDTDLVDENGQVRRHDLLAIRVVSNQGKIVPIFATKQGGSTSAIPYDSDEPIDNALEKVQGQQPLHLAFEWRNPELETPGVSTIVRPKAFLAFEEHSSVLGMVEQQQSNKEKIPSVTLDQCFEKFVKPERLDDENMWYCSECKEHVRATKTMKVWRLPNILVVHLKRFEFKHAFRRDKLDTLVDFPLEGLDMAKHCDLPQEGKLDNSDNFLDASFEAKYDLFGVVNHYGKMGFGHYTAHCRQWDEDGQFDRWNFFDDSNVSPSEAPATPSSAAYVLFYRRRHFH